MAGYDKSGSYDFKALEKKYGNFLSPTFKIRVGSFRLDSSKIPVSHLQIQLSTENRAGMCSFTVEAMYNYETGVWAEGFLDKVDVGMKVTVEIGYAESQRQIFLGYVDKYRIDYSSQGAPQLHISAMDGLGVLMSNREKIDFGKRKTTDVVKQLVSDCTRAGIITGSSVDALPSFEGQFVKEKASSSYDFLCRIAEMCFMNFCIINGELLFSNLMKNTATLLSLTMGVSLIEFSKTIAFSQQTVGSVTVISNGTVNKEEVRSKADSPSRYGDSSGKTGAEKWKALGGANKDVVMNFLKSADECKIVAQNILDSMCLGFVQGSGRCIGIPELIPGRYIKLAGLDKETNGSYFVTAVTHTFSGDGYFTEFEVKGFRSK
ncbi:MAG: phage late control D family protein [Clostridia bacterium]|nr:phage late control D family protein [Clostridia bacterium]